MGPVSSIILLRKGESRAFRYEVSKWGCVRKARRAWLRVRSCGVQRRGGGRHVVACGGRSCLGRHACVGVLEAAARRSSEGGKGSAAGAAWWASPSAACAQWSPPRGPALARWRGGMHAYMCTTLSIVRPRADDGRAHHYSADGSVHTHPRCRWVRGPKPTTSGLGEQLGSVGHQKCAASSRCCSSWRQGMRPRSPLPRGVVPWPGFERAGAV